MSEVQEPSPPSQEQQPSPLTSGEVEQLRRGDTSLEASSPEPTYADKRQRFIDQVADFRHRADKAEVEAETLDHVHDELHHLNAEAKRAEAEKLREAAAQTEADAAQFDAEHPPA